MRHTSHMQAWKQHIEFYWFSVDPTLGASSYKNENQNGGSEDGGSVRQVWDTLDKCENEGKRDYCTLYNLPNGMKQHVYTYIHIYIYTIHSRVFTWVANPKISEDPQLSQIECRRTRWFQKERWRKQSDNSTPKWRGFSLFARWFVWRLCRPVTFGDYSLAKVSGISKSNLAQTWGLSHLQ